jgi:hypothetical protein
VSRPQINGAEKADQLHSLYLHAIARKSAPRSLKTRVRHPLFMAFPSNNDIAATRIFRRR